MITRLLEMTGGRRAGPIAIDRATGEQANPSGQPAAAPRHGPVLAAMLVAGLAVMVWLDRADALDQPATPPSSSLPDADYRRLPPDLRACFVRIGSDDKWRLLSRCRAQPISREDDKS